MIYRRLIKPTFDFLLAATLLLLVSPIFILAYILLFFANNGKAFFYQQRPGKNERIFSIIKFKSMNDKKDADGNLLPDKDRITVVGNIVRKTSLDEIPQLINVLKGDMSFVGPRPLLVSYLPLYNETQKKRHWVKPGITGWSQVNGRNAITWEQRFEQDVWYVENQSFWLDLKIIFKTAIKVVKREGVSTEAGTTMEVFTGNK